MELIPRIREKRMEAHLTQKDLCEKIGMKKSQLSPIERGKIKPNPEILWRIAKGIDCLVDDLYEVANDSDNNEEVSK